MSRETPVVFTALFASGGTVLTAAFSEDAAFTPEFTGVIQVPSSRAFHGPYTVVPGAEAQILETDGLLMTDNVTVEPIPSNYGLITWDGSALTVS